MPTTGKHREKTMAFAWKLCQDICISQFVNNLWCQYTSMAYQLNCVKTLALWKCAQNEAMLPRACPCSTKKIKVKKKKWSYDEMRSGWTGKYLALGQDARTSLRSSRTFWPWAKNFPVRPSLINKYTELGKCIVLYIDFTFLQWVKFTAVRPASFFLFQNESCCTTFQCLANLSHLHLKGFTLGLVLKWRK